VSEAFRAVTRKLRILLDARSNTFLAGLETLAVTLDLERHHPNDLLRFFVMLVNSIPSASIVQFILLLDIPHAHMDLQLDWLALADAIQRRHRGLLPGARKAVRVAIVASELSGPCYHEFRPSIADDLVPLVQSATQCIRPYADVEVVGGTDATFGAVSPVPHFRWTCRSSKI
jgi:hypothetical protein